MSSAIFYININRLWMVGYFWKLPDPWIN